MPQEASKVRPTINSTKHKKLPRKDCQILHITTRQGSGGHSSIRSLVHKRTSSLEPFHRVCDGEGMHGVLECCLWLVNTELNEFTATLHQQLAGQPCERSAQHDPTHPKTYAHPKPAHTLYRR